MRFLLLLVSMILFSVNASAVVLFSDDFERTSLGSDWNVSNSSRGLITSQTASSPGERALVLRHDPVNVESNSFDLSTYGSATLTYWWRRGDDDFSEDPDNNEDLIVEYSDDGGSSWIELERYAGEGTPGEIDTETINLPNGAFVADFQFRFRLQNGNGSDWDYWHVDDVVLDATGALSCFSDNFNRGSVGDDWVPSNVGGSFTPSIVSNSRLRLTQNVGNQSTATTLQRLFPASGNRVEIEFDHYAWSPQGGGGADGIAVVLSDASVTPQAGSFGGSLGYAQRNNGDEGFAGGWLGIAIDEYGNFANNNEGRQGGIGRTRDSVSMRGSGSGTSGYQFITSTSTLSPGIDVRSTSTPEPGYRYRFIIDSTIANQVWVSVFRRTGSTFTQLIAPVDVAAQSGQAAIPQDLMLSFTGSTGGSNNNHEIDNLSVCADTINPISDTVHHFEWVFGSNALTCSPADVTLRACENADCSVLFTDPVTVDLSPTGWVGGDSVTFSGGTANLQLRQATPGNITLNVDSSDPPRQAFQTDVCVRNGSSGTNCNITFEDSGFLVSVDNFVANQGIQNATINAVRRDLTTQACVPGFANVTRNIEFWSGYDSPNAGSMSVSLRGNSGVSPSYQVLGQSEATATTVALDFDANGQAEVDVNYADAGQMRLNAKYTENIAGGTLEMENTDGSGFFVSRPAGFCITAERLDASSNTCATSNSDCTTFVKAGEDFNMSVQAVAYDSNTLANLCDNAGTPNFSGTINLSQTLVQPAAGDNGVLSVTSYGHTADNSGVSDGINLTRLYQSRVGVFDFSVAQINNYFGQSGFNIPGAITQTPVGRFYPDHFDVTVGLDGSLQPFCNTGTGFSYSGQDINWNIAPTLNIAARNVQNITTTNYTRGGFMKLNNDDVSFDAVVTDSSATQSDGVTAISLTSTFNNGTVSVADPTSGQAQYELSNLDVFIYTRELAAQVNQFIPDLDIALDSVTDSDGVAGTGVTIEPDGNQQIRFGRWHLSSVYGPEVVDLNMPAQVEYFDNDRYILNTNDTCTIYNSANASVSAISAIINGSGNLAAGQTNIGLRAPTAVAGTPDTGTATVTYSADSWLQGDYDGNGTFEDPSATATFGVFRGHDRIIYWREITN